ncbi:MAG: hypothetical protein ABI873_00780 [Marmoricola sp.]
MTFPMTFAYMEAYAAVRSCLGALADISDLLGVPTRLQAVGGR